MSKVIPAQQSKQARRWPLPRVGGAGANSGEPGSANPMAGIHPEAYDASVEALAIREQAHHEGFREGYEEGLQAARAESTSLINRLHNLLGFLEHPAEALERQVEQELLELALAVARQILRREIRTDPRHIIGLIREAIKQLPANLQNISVHLHPDDAAVIRDTLHEHASERRWRIVDDPGLSQGECRVTTDSSFVDAGIDGLIARLAADLLGGHRISDAGERQPDSPPQSQALAEDI